MITVDALLYSLKDLLIEGLIMVYYHWSDEQDNTHLVLLSCMVNSVLILVINIAFMNYVWNQLFMFEVSVALLYDIII